ncbi:MAG TPA: UTP--glucose-1-phosphate uridylyltransferase [Actinomycetota bacterium]|nr:UTP--glucose-1-phosphate uridylyltransferase [Actinomycetota bacterium]
MPPRKAVIPAAGLGTRFLPASKAVPKELITLVDRPVIQYAVEELARAGITNICIVNSHGKEAVADHFTTAPRLEAALIKAAKDELLRDLKRISNLAEVYSVRQNEPLGLGHAVWVAREHIGEEPFVVSLPDEIFDPRDNFLSEMISGFDETGCSIVAVHEVSHEEIQLYGAIDPVDADAEIIEVRGVVEKPHPSVAPSHLALSGRYVLGPEVFDIIEKLEKGAGGEIQLADALGVLAERGTLRAMRYRGRRWDVGKKEGYLEAFVELAAEHPELGPRFRGFLKDFRP